MRRRCRAVLATLNSYWNTLQRSLLKAKRQRAERAQKGRTFGPFAVKRTLTMCAKPLVVV